MEEKLKKLADMAKKILGKETDFMIVTHTDGTCGTILNGNTENIAQSIFYSMHDQKQSTAVNLYRIIKLNAVNIMSNPSPYAINLSNALNNTISDQL